MDNERRCHLAAACVHAELYSQFVNLIARKEFGVCGYMCIDSAPSPDLIFEELPDGLSLLGL
jgi:hypothetical protein